MAVICDSIFTMKTSWPYLCYSFPLGSISRHAAKQITVHEVMWLNGIHTTTWRIGVWHWFYHKRPKIAHKLLPSVTPKPKYGPSILSCVWKTLTAIGISLFTAAAEIRQCTVGRSDDREIFFSPQRGLGLICHTELNWEGVAENLKSVERCWESRNGGKSRGNIIYLFSAPQKVSHLPSLKLIK